MDDLLAFSIPEQPGWRSGLDTAPPVSEMVTDIVKYVNIYGEFKRLENKKDDITKAKRAILMEFLLNVQQAEGVGVKTAEETRGIIDRLDQQNRGTEPSSDTSSSGTNENRTEESPELLESFPGMEEDIPKAHESNTCTDQGAPSKSVHETKNLYKAYCTIVKHIKEAKKEFGNKREFQLSVGLMDVQTCVIDLHRILMDGVMPEGKFPGRFSTSERVTRYKGKIHRYPLFENEDIADSTVEYLIDMYNKIADKTKQNARMSEEERYLSSFKCASLFLFSFLSVHPFADGNGRLARLLTSYSLLTFSQFMTPIYNVFSTSKEEDYIDALVKARANMGISPNIEDKKSGVRYIDELLLQKPADLCAMLIESNWATWRQFLCRIGYQSIVLHQWEKPIVNV